MSRKHWVTQKLPQISTANHATFQIRIRKITVQICGYFWVTQYILLQFLLARRTHLRSLNFYFSALKRRGEREKGWKGGSFLLTVKVLCYMFIIYLTLVSTL